ncbi:hypothetical protein [Neisseria elongata]|nr:hypothetical protein [Neisseria elongata]
MKKTAFSGGFVGFVLFSGSAGYEKARVCGRVEWGGLCLIHGDQGGFG